MENYSNCPGYGHFNDADEAQNVLVHNGLSGRVVPEGLSFEDFRYDVDLEVTNFNPTSVLESKNSSAQSTFRTDITSSQPSSHTAFSYAGNNHFNSALLPHEGTEFQNWLPTSNASAGCTKFRQEINNSDEIAESSMGPVFMPLYIVQSPQIIAASLITFQQSCNEPMKPLVYAPQEDFEQLQDGESGAGGGDLLTKSSLNSGENPQQQLNSTARSRSRWATKPKPQTPNLCCNIRPCSYQKAFGRKADLKRHQATQHPQIFPSEIFRCPWPECEGKGAKEIRRRDKIQLHQKKVHGRRL